MPTLRECQIFGEFSSWQTIVFDDFPVGKQLFLIIFPAVN